MEWLNFRNKKQKVSAREEIAPAEEETTEKVEVENGGASEESNKKRVDMLWADFLKDVEGPTKNSKEVAANSHVILIFGSPISFQDSIDLLRI